MRDAASDVCARQRHGLRHRFASRAVELGESLPMIGKILGHTPVQGTARYAHLARDTVKALVSRARDSIGEALASTEIRKFSGSASPVPRPSRRQYRQIRLGSASRRR